MAFFTQAKEQSLYLAENGPPNAGAVAFVTRSGAPTSGTLELSEALTCERLSGSFVFAPRALNFGDDCDLQADFVNAVWAIIAKQPAARGFLWVADPSSIASQPVLPFLGLNQNGTSLATGLGNGNILTGLSLSIQNGMAVSLADDTLSFTNGSIGFSGASAPEMSAARNGTLPFSGQQRGCIVFDPFIKRLSLYEDWNWGFQFIFPQDSSPQGLISEWLPLASGTTGSTDMLGFITSIDLANPINTAETIYNTNQNRSGLVFTGKNEDSKSTTLASYFRTVTGEAVSLTPIGASDASDSFAEAGLAFALGQRISDSNEDFHASPFGDFVIDAPAGPNGVTAELLCGLSGSEFVSVIPGTTPAKGSRIRFTTQCGAYTNEFPPPVASPTGTPSDNASLLNTTFTTSWAALLPPSGNSNTYAAQPEGAALFGYDQYVWQNYPSLLGHMDPAYVLPDSGSDPFPMVPYSGFSAGDGTVGYSQLQSRNFETLVVGPTRRENIGKVSQGQVLSARNYTSGQTLSATASSLTNFTTPSGLIATIDTGAGSASWQKILLGQIQTPVASEMSFDKPSPELQQAFQTNQLFMVASNNRFFVDSGGNFSNELNIGGWSIQADVGNSPNYGDYANVMIVKCIEGPLYDPDGDPKDNLVGNSDKWTQADTFSSPTILHEGSPDSSQMVNLSQWLQDYFQDALAQDDQEFFGDFNAIAKDKNWTGIIVLRAKIANPPGDLAGITAGVRDTSAYYAHHLAIAISQIKSDSSNGGIGIEKQSSVYGLIYYIDPDYDASSPSEPVPPAYGKSYDFITLTLKVLFENTAVKQFSSFTQLAINQFFGSNVSGMGDGGNAYNSVIMTGTFQNNNGKPTYGMKALGDYSFLFNSNILNKVEIISAEMNTISTDSENTLVRFGLSGFIDFLLLDGTVNGNTMQIDLYSFGSPAGEQTARTGLNYGSLGLNMAFETAQPVATQTISFDSSQISFNVAASTVRAGSLFDSLSLDLQSLMSGRSEGGEPRSLGYLDVVTNVRLSGVNEEWNGLNFKINLGSAGELAGKVGLNAYLILAWSPDSVGSKYQALTGIQMPGTTNGASLISLQNVLSLSFGTIQLLYTNEPGTLLHPTTLLPVDSSYTGQKGKVLSAKTADTNMMQFMLVLNEIVIKFFGLLKIPPNGSTGFYLFGDASAKSSDNDTGLGWYGVYNNEPSEEAKSQRQSQSLAHEGTEQ